MTQKGTKSCRWVPKWVKKPAKKIQRFFICGGKETKSEEFAVTIEPFESVGEVYRKGEMGAERRTDAEGAFSPPLDFASLADQFDCVFRRYFQRRADQFAMFDVRSERSACVRHRQIRHAKQIVSSMIEFWEEQRQRERLFPLGRTNAWDEGPTDALMDTYFACLYNLFARSIQILEEFYPRLKTDGRHGSVPTSFSVAGGYRRHYAKRQKKHFSDITYSTPEQRSISMEGSVVNFGANGGGSEMEEMRQYRNGRPKSIVCYF